jgi:SnoaL-like domain
MSNTETETALSRLIDEASIRDATARFADAATRGDYDSFRKLWSDAGEFTIGDPPRAHAAGVDDVVSMLRRLRDGRAFFVQLAVQGPIEINGDEATTSCICHEAARGPGESYYRNYCVSSDRLKRSGDRWVFTNRTFRYLWLDTSPFTGDAFPLSSDGAAPG